jgi:hypothetical protein
VLLLLSLVMTVGALGTAAAQTRRAPAVEPTAYVHGVCVALGRWVQATGSTPEHVRAIADDYHAGKLTSRDARRQTLTVTRKAKQASDNLVKAVRAAGAPTLDNGAKLAREELTAVRDVAHVYQFIGRDLNSELDTVKDSQLYRLLEYVATDANSQLDFAEMPLQPLLDDTALAPLVNSDGACATVLDAYRMTYEPSGLEAGDCVSLDTSSVVPCTSAHDAEVIANLTYPAAAGAPYPGVAGLNTFTDTGCAAAFETYVGIPATASRYSYIVMAPSRDLWEAGDREVICLAGFGGEGTTAGSIRGAAQ